MFSLMPGDKQYLAAFGRSSNSRGQQQQRPGRHGHWLAQQRLSHHGGISEEDDDQSEVPAATPRRSNGGAAAASANDEPAGAYNCGGGGSGFLDLVASAELVAAAIYGGCDSTAVARLRLACTELASSAVLVSRQQELLAQPRAGGVARLFCE
jgi:hypothetical protein